MRIGFRVLRVISSFDTINRGIYENRHMRGLVLIRGMVEGVFAKKISKLTNFSDFFLISDIRNPKRNNFFGSFKFLCRVYVFISIQDL